MNTAPAKLMAAEEFWEWGCLPENQNRRCELDRGTIVDLPPAGRFHGVVCAVMTYLLGNYCFQRRKGYVCSNETGLILERGPDTVCGPDLMLFDQAKRYEELGDRWAEDMPSLIVEVLSPEDKPGKMARRIKQYLRREISLVWVVIPEERIVTVFRPGAEFSVMEADQEITGEDVLPDLGFVVRDCFTLPGQVGGQAAP